MRPRFLPAKSSALAALVPALAAPCAIGQTLWHCWPGDQVIACSLAASTSGAVRPVSDAAVAPVADRLPAGLRVLRKQPALLRGRIMNIPLHTVPFGNSALAELAQAVMCGRNSDCLVRYGEHPADTPESAAVFADAHDPLLQGGE